MRVANSGAKFCPDMRNGRYDSKAKIIFSKSKVGTLSKSTSPIRDLPKRGKESLLSGAPRAIGVILRVREPETQGETWKKGFIGDLRVGYGTNVPCYGAGNSTDKELRVCGHDAFSLKNFRQHEGLVPVGVGSNLWAASLYFVRGFLGGATYALVTGRVAPARASLYLSSGCV